MKQEAFVSIDWDYFFPGLDAMDWGHRESPFFILQMWSLRAQHREEVQPVIPELWWDVLREQQVRFPESLIVTESHCEAYPHANPYQVMVLFDAHHDCWAPRDKDGIQCDTWVSEWLRRNRRRSVYWAYPPWMGNDMLKGYLDAIPVKFRNRVIVGTGMDVLTHYRAGRLHLCRSGAWCPPWCDEDFIAFANASGCVVSQPPRKHDFDPMKPRWTAAETEAIVAERKAMMDRIKSFHSCAVPSDKVFNQLRELVL